MGQLYSSIATDLDDTREYIETIRILSESDTKVLALNHFDGNSDRFDL